ncbi:MAG: hypothetical protein ACRDQ5_21760 [Sciscionella sp.]
MRTYRGTDVLAVADELAELHGDVFLAPPWSVDLAVSREFRERLETDAYRLGFRAVIAEGTHGIDGSAPVGSPSGRSPPAAPTACTTTGHCEG